MGPTCAKWPIEFECDMTLNLKVKCPFGSHVDDDALDLSDSDFLNFISFYLAVDA